MSFLRTSGALLAAALYLLPAAARAWPVDKLLDIKEGEAQTLRFASLRSAETDSPAVLALRRGGEGELSVSGLKEGRALLYLADESRIAVWRVRVRKEGGRTPAAEPSPALKQAAAKACPTFEERNEEGGRVLEVQVPDAPCRAALRALFQADAYPARDLRLGFKEAALQDQLQAMEAALAKAGIQGLELAYAGATLQLKGKATVDQRDRALKLLFEAAVGSIPLDDQIEVPSPGGAPTEEGRR